MKAEVRKITTVKMRPYLSVFSENNCSDVIRKKNAMLLVRYHSLPFEKLSLCVYNDTSVITDLLNNDIKLQSKNKHFLNFINKSKNKLKSSK